VGRKIDVEDLVDANGVAEMLGLSHRNSVATYQRRYPSMPSPVVNMSNSRIKLWLRSEVSEWIATRERRASKE